MRVATEVMILVLIGTLIVWDFMAYALAGVEATISRVILRACQRSPFWAFAAGFLCGHLFAPQLVEQLRKLFAKEYPH